MNQNEKKEIMGKFAKKLEKCYKKRSCCDKRNRKWQSSNKILRSSKVAGAALDTTAYESYDAWIDTIKKTNKEIWKHSYKYRV